jgi:uncharacterized protein HemY
VAVGLLAVLGCAEAEKGMTKSRTSLIEAREAIAAGDSAKAIELLNASIADQPNTWAYFELAKLQLAGGDEPAALASCDAALQLDPESPDIVWLKGEIGKPEANRFKGRFKDPPSARK